MAQHLYDAALCAAFWVAVWQFRGAPAGGLYFVVGLGLGAVFARAGGLIWAPAGLVLLAPWHATGRARFLDAALPALPLAFAVAKLGCLAAGCCALAGGEALGFAAVHVAARGLPQRHAAAFALAGIGLVRLAALPFRPEAYVSALPATVWLALAALRCRPSHGEPRCLRPGNVTSSRTGPSSSPGCAVRSVVPATSR